MGISAHVVAALRPDMSKPQGQPSVAGVSHYELQHV